MNKKIKKLLPIILITISIIGIIFIILYAKNNKDYNEDKMMIGENINGQTPPEIPSGEDSDMQEESSENGNFTTASSNQNINPNSINQNSMMSSNSLTTIYIVIIGIFSCIISLSLLYLIMSKQNDKFYKNQDKLIIYILANIILTSCITICFILIANNIILKKSTSFTEEKETVTLNLDNVASSDMINLSTEKSDVTIKNGGTYTFSGSFNHSIIIDAEDEGVEVILDNVEISNENTAAIIGLSANIIKITLADSSVNTLSDGGNSEYDSCIFSNAELVFSGNGKLTVSGNQNEGEGIATETQNITFNSGTYNITSNDDGINAGGDGGTITINGGVFYIDASGDGIDSNKNAIINGGTIFVMGSDIGADAGIDTDDGFEINGGLVVALGSDMIETPLDSSTQKTIAFSLNESISKDKIVTLMKEDKEIISFKATKSFKTIIISTSDLVDGDYTLYNGGSNSGTFNNGIYENSSYIKGEKITINNIDTFTISKTVNFFKNSGR